MRANLEGDARRRGGDQITGALTAPYAGVERAKRGTPANEGTNMAEDEALRILREVFGHERFWA